MKPELTITERLQSRARAKYLSTAVNYNLKQFAETNREFRYYERSENCNLFLQANAEGTEISGTFCNSRTCLICNRLRTAKYIEGYSGIISELPEPSFLTLTTKNCNVDLLQWTIKRQLSELKKIKDKLRKQGLKITGIRKIECTYNDKENTFHPHLHLITDTFEGGQRILNNWFEVWPDLYEGAQDCRPIAEGLSGEDKRAAVKESARELFKYFSKVITRDKKGAPRFNSYALFEIVKAMKGTRIIQPFGLRNQQVAAMAKTKYGKEYFAGIPLEALEAATARVKMQYDCEPFEVFRWLSENWYGQKTGENLSNYKPGEKMKKLCNFVEKN